MKRQPTPVLLPGKSHGWRSMVGYSPWGRKEQHDWTTSLSLSLWLSDSSIFPSLSNMLCVTDIFIFNINLWQRIWPTSWNIWNYHWGVKPGLDIIIHKWSCTYRSFPQCFGSEIELMLWWDAAAPAKSLQSCLTLCNPIEGSPPGSPVPGILQTRTLEWVAISFSNAWKWKVKMKSLSRVRL